ncbi:MAG: type II toxin-antitoxin system PemK/MazF family toxin [Treponema sp.]|nr:type II toxin-antitoxin system PemK/MazF family toxin [Treponema sp.]
MKRGELWTLQDKGYSSKARPVLIVQADVTDNFDSIILCLFTSYKSDNISTRVKIDPNNKNGLEKISYVMTEKIITVEKAMLGKCIGYLSDDEMHQIAGKLAKLLNIKKNDIEDN